MDQNVRNVLPPCRNISIDLTTFVKQDVKKKGEFTFLKCFIDVDLTGDKVLVVLYVGEDATLVYPVVVMRAEEEDREVTNVVAQALNV